MPKKTKRYRDWLTPKLADPDRSARYLNAALEDSEAMFLKALRKVAEAQPRPMCEIAELCGVSRESLYRMLSENGNPTSENRRAILAALGLKSIVLPIERSKTTTGPGPKQAKHGAISSKATITGNALSGTIKDAAGVLSFGGITLAVPVRKGPAHSSGNFSSSGHLEELAMQTGVHS